MKLDKACLLPATATKKNEAQRSDLPQRAKVRWDRRRPTHECEPRNPFKGRKWCAHVALGGKLRGHRMSQSAKASYASASAICSVITSNFMSSRLKLSIVFLRSR